ncbi:unnamed protein product [Paramecium pentaurelia]|uniref:Uncharacterized protein n=1 Tax=Paramecium pentaurelia TaxID=43138 RepID=A0A8S1YKG3_9CILI|nr:unnamed protein product [Paramecium pentaurelia]
MLTIKDCYKVNYFNNLLEYLEDQVEEELYPQKLLPQRPIQGLDGDVVGEKDLVFRVSSETTTIKIRTKSPIYFNLKRSNSRKGSFRATQAYLFPSFFLSVKFLNDFIRQKKNQRKQASGKGHKLASQQYLPRDFKQVVIQTNKYIK